MNYNDLINELNQNISNLTKEEKDIIDAEQKLQEKKLQVIKTKNANQTRLRFLKLIERPDSFFNNQKVLSLIVSLEKIEDNQLKEDKPNSTSVSIDKEPDVFYGDKLTPEQLKGGSTGTQHIKHSYDTPSFHDSKNDTSSSDHKDLENVHFSNTTNDDFPDDLADFGLFDNQENSNKENDDDSDDDNEEKVKTVRAKIKK